MEVIFKSVWQSCENLRFNIKKERIQGSALITGKMSDLSKKMMALGLFLKKTDTASNVLFLNKNYGKFVRLHQTVFGDFNEWYKLDEKTMRDKMFRGAYDLIYKQGFGISKFRSVVDTLATTIFTEFCKGITYFENEKDKSIRPIYHRYNSCGAANETTESKFSKQMLKSSNKKWYLRKCFIERLIYNKIYVNIFESQDMGHLDELQKIERLYDDNFPNENLTIKMTFRNIIYPITVDINWNDHNEVYRKQYIREHGYSTIVSCTNYNSGKLYEKIQTFTEETSWIRADK